MPRSFSGSVFGLSTPKTARKRCSVPAADSGSRLCTVTRGGTVPRWANEAAGPAVSNAAAINAMTIRISISDGAPEVGADDLPFSAIVDELELEAIEVGVDAVDQRRARAPAEHTRMHDGACGALPFDDDLVDAAHDLDSLVGDEIAA